MHMTSYISRSKQCPNRGASGASDRQYKSSHQRIRRADGHVIRSHDFWRELSAAPSAAKPRRDFHSRYNRKEESSRDITPFLKAFSPEGVIFEVSVAPLFPVGDVQHCFSRGGVEEHIDWTKVD